MHNQRLLIVANRLPVTVRAQEAGIETIASSGGLASGLGPWHRRSNGLWVGWPGECAETADERVQVEDALSTAGMVPVHLTRAQVDGYYHEFANAVLWPLF